MDVKQEFGAVIKRERTGLGLSQEALAERADLHRTYITDIERGTRNLTLESIAKLAGALGVGIGQLFPADSGNGAEKRDENQPAVKNGTVDLLLVEDDPKDIEQTLNAFQQAKFANRVHVVRDGEEALEFIFSRGKFRSRLTERPPHAVLLDLNLPKVHGLDVLRRLKSDSRTREVKVVVLSASRRDEHVRRALELGAAGHIVKPVDFQNFSQITPKLDFWWTLLKPEVRPGVGAAAGQGPD